MSYDLFAEDLGPIGGLADGELLAYLAGPSAPHLLARFGSLGAVLAARPGELLAAGASHGATATIKAAQEAARRIARESVLDRPMLTCWDAVVTYARTRIGHDPAERFLLLFLDKKNRLIADEVQQRGTVDHTPVYPREVMKRALELNASHLILVHNHPSGDPTPSRLDIETTRQIAEAAKALGIVVHDHIVIASAAHFSFKAQGLL